MISFFEFYEKVRSEKRYNEQDQPQSPKVDVAPDANPEQQVQGQATQDQQGQEGQQDDSTSQLSEPAHDPKLEELMQQIKDTLPQLKPANKKMMQELLDKMSSPDKKENPEDQSKEQQPDQSAQGQQQAQNPVVTPQPIPAQQPDIQAAPMSQQQPMPQ